MTFISTILRVLTNFFTAKHRIFTTPISAKAAGANSK